MKLFVIRHGQTEWNVLKKMQGLADIPLNNKGIEQANEVKKKINELDIDIIYCSPLIRAKQTAEIINTDKRLDIIIDDKIKERDYGEFEGINKKTFNYNDFWAYKKNIKYKKAENIQDFFERVNTFIEELRNNYSNKNVLVVTHAGVLKAIECNINGIMNDEDIEPYLPDNGKILEYNLKS